ncbi:MAG: SEC-C domain-containing protein [Spirochaetia bacterium]
MVEIRHGHHALNLHQPLRALRCFERALLSVPATRLRPAAGRKTAEREESQRALLANLFYYIAVSLWKVGMRNMAMGSWVESVRLSKRGNARRKLARVTNEYGMARQVNEDRDDQQAFYGVQLSRYIRSKKSHKLGTRAEIDMVVELVEEYWNQIGSSGILDDMGHKQRFSLFRDTVIVFPFLSVPEALKTDDVAINFYHGTRVGSDDRCACGSGLPYRTCHGRTPGIDEILTGKF